MLKQNNYKTSNIDSKSITIKEKVSKKLEQAYNLLSTAVYLITGYATYESTSKILATAGVILLMMGIYKIVEKSFK
jgi:hypothetical protein